MQSYEDIQAVNFSSLKHIETSPLDYQWALEHPREDTDALLRGRVMHCLTLEPGEFEARYMVAPNVQCSATTWKGVRCSRSALSFAEHCTQHGGEAEVGAWLSDHAGVEVVDEESFATLRRCVTAVWAHPDASKLLTGCRFEQVITWTDAATGLSCKGRLDAIGPGRVIDLKTTRDIARFASAAARLLYHAGLAWYLDGAIAAGVLEPGSRAYSIPVQTIGPPDVGALELRGADLDAGRDVYRRCLDTLASCLESGVWYGKYPALAPLELPRWAPGLEPEEV